MINLSPSSLNLFLECPRCFWLQFNKYIRRPQGPMSTLPSGADLTLKNYFDHWRQKGLPPEIKGQLPGKLLPDQDKIREMRSRNFGFQVNNNIWFGGLLDDALKLPDSSIVPLDNKTKGFPPKESHWTHKTQMSGYSLILREKGFPTKNLAYLIHWFFDHHNFNLKDPLKFNIAVEEVVTNPDDIKAKIFQAVVCLKQEIPEPGYNSGINHNEICPFCYYRDLKY